jgi:hypothetical protein
VTETGARVCAEHLPMGKPAFLAEPAPASPGEGYRWLVPGVDTYQPGDELQASDGWVLVSALVHGNVVGDGGSPVRRRIEQTPEEPAQPQPPAEPPLVIRDDVGREIRIGMRVGCRNAGEPCDRSVRGLTLVGYEPGTDRPYVTNAGRFAVALLDHQPHMERWAAENVRSGGQPPPPSEPPAEATPRRPSVIPADWPRDMHGMLLGPQMPKWAGMDINQRRRALAEWIGRIPDPPGGWRGRDAIAFDAIHSMMTFFAPITSDDWMEWRPIQEAATALVQMVEAIEREQLAQMADEVEVGL